LGLFIFCGGWGALGCASIKHVLNNASIGAAEFIVIVVVGVFLGLEVTHSGVRMRKKGLFRQNKIRSLRGGSS
jgi:hypothetical protein